jgi:hypothetical protein
LVAGLTGFLPGEVTDEPPLRAAADEPMLLGGVPDEGALREVADEPMALGEVTEVPSPGDITHESSFRDMTDESLLREKTEESPGREVTDESPPDARAVGGIISSWSGIGMGMLVWHFLQRMTRPAALSLTL